MNIIFFDIDGVLNFHGSKGALADNEKVDMLIDLAEKTNSKLVMSSSWKEMLINPALYSTPDVAVVSSLVDSLGELFIGFTPDTAPDEREIEVQSWLDEHPETDNFVILDDVPFGFKETFPDNFVQTSGLECDGLTEENVNQAIRILNG